MESFSQHNLVESTNGFELILYLGTNTEFSSELGTTPQENSLKMHVQSFIQSKKNMAQTN